MNELLQKSFNTPTMSSREIATLCDKEHRNVCRDIENLNATYGQMGMLKIEQTPYTHEQNGQTYYEYQLTKEQCIDLITGYRADLRIKINRRWQELEQATAPRLPQTFADALRAYADEVEAREKLEQQLALAEPKVEYFDALVNRNLLLNFTTVAKELGVKRKVLIGYLLENNYIYRDANNTLLPYSQHTPHLFEVKEYTKDNYAGVQTLVTPRGRETLRLLLSGLPSV